MKCLIISDYILLDPEEINLRTFLIPFETQEKHPNRNASLICSISPLA